MKLAEIIMTFLGIVGGIFTIFIVDDLRLRIEISLLILVVVLVGEIIILCSSNRALSKQLAEIQTRNDSLARLYKKKDKALKKTRRYWGYMCTLFIQTLASSQKERFQTAFEQYRAYTSELEDDYEED